MKSPFTRDFYRPENLRQTWEYKTLAFILRAMVAIVVVMYLIFTAQPTWAWMQREYVRSQPLSRLDGLLDEGRRTGDYAAAHKWINYRANADAPVIAAAIVNNSEALPALFFNYVARYHRVAGNMEEFAFWNYFMRYRLRYDLLRCGNPDWIDRIDAIMGQTYALQGRAEYLETLEKDPQRLAAMLTRVLDYDASHPARNNPSTTCLLISRSDRGNYSLQPQSEWAATRHSLRLVTEYSLREMRQMPQTDSPAQDGVNAPAQNNADAPASHNADAPASNNGDAPASDNGDATAREDAPSP